MEYWADTGELDEDERHEVRDFELVYFHQNSPVNNFDASKKLKIIFIF